MGPREHFVPCGRLARNHQQSAEKDGSQTCPLYSSYHRVPQKTVIRLSRHRTIGCDGVRRCDRGHPKGDDYSCAPAIPGADELVENGVTGYLVPPNSVDAITEAILKLASDPSERARLGNAARLHVEQFFDNNKNIVALAELFKGSLARR